MARWLNGEAKPLRQILVIFQLPFNWLNGTALFCVLFNFLQTIYSFSTKQYIAFQPILNKYNALSITLITYISWKVLTLLNEDNFNRPTKDSFEHLSSDTLKLVFRTFNSLNKDEYLSTNQNSHSPHKCVISKMRRRSHDGVRCHIVFHSDRYAKTVSYSEHWMFDPECQNACLQKM